MRATARCRRGSKNPLSSPGFQRERATGVEPPTSSLVSWHSTTELRPQRPETVAHSSSPRNTTARARFLDCLGTRAYDPSDPHGDAPRALELQPDGHPGAVRGECARSRG